MEIPWWKQRRVIRQIVYVLLAILVILLFVQLSYPNSKAAKIEPIQLTEEEKKNTLNNPNLTDEQKKVLDEAFATSQVAVLSANAITLQNKLRDIFLKLGSSTDQDEIKQLFADLDNLLKQWKLDAKPLTLDEFVDVINKPQFEGNAAVSQKRNEVVKQLNEMFKDNSPAFKAFQQNNLEWIVRFIGSISTTVVTQADFNTSMNDLSDLLKKRNNDGRRPAEPPELPWWGQVLGITGALTLAYFSGTTPQFENVL